MNIANIKKIFLYTFITSISISALLGIIVTLTGTVEQNSKILLTALTITTASFSMFLNGIFFERMFGKILPALGFLLTGVAAVLCIGTIWSNDFTYKPLATVIVLLFANFFLFPFAFYYEESKRELLPIIGSASTIIAALLSVRAIWEFSPNKFLERLFFVALVFAIACFYLSLIFLITLSKRYAWTMRAVQITVWTMVAILLWLIIFEPQLAQTAQEIVSRGLVILSIIIAALTVMIPIFYRLSRAELETPEKITVEEIEEKIARHRAQIDKLEKMKKSILEESPHTKVSESQTETLAQN